MGMNNKQHHQGMRFVFGGIEPETAPSAFVAPTATVIGDVSLGAGASVWFGCVLRGDRDRIRVGENTNLQDLSVCHTDDGMPLTVGSGVTVGHRCVLHGCTIENDCLIGMGAIIMNGAVVGRGSVVAAGATILENTVIPPFSLVAGVPGKIKRTFTESEILPKIIASARDYLDLSREYLAKGIK
jgi:carbonic anhydrase/acetyltransferase-like protein (isoleucine patch superfamily)